MGFVPPFNARVDSRNGVSRISLTGELDLATVPVLEDRLAPLGHHAVAAVLLDLRDLLFTDATGIHAFRRAGDLLDVAGRRLVLVGARRPVRRVFELTGTQSLLEDLDAAAVLARYTGDRTLTGPQAAIGENADA